MIGPRAIRERSLPESGSELPDDLNPAVRRVLLARGITNSDQLSLGLKNMLHPEHLGGIETAADHLASAVMEDRRILIVGDFDADGATGTALAMLALRSMGCQRLEFRVPNRFEFGYGLTPGLVETLAGQPPDLLVTVDSGINCVAGVARAGELGCRVIVTDHHLPGDALPAAAAIVNPNCPGDTFPSKALAGVGVMFYLLSVVRRVLRERDWFSKRRPEPRLVDYLDLVALGTVADLVPLDYNNRILVRQGLERIRRGQARPGLMALLRLGNRDYRYASASDLGFAVGPRLNAAGRLEDMATGIRCLLSDDVDEAARLAALLDDLNRQRRNLQEQMQEEAMGQLQDTLSSLAGSRLPPALCLYQDNWHQGIVGLVASRVKDSVHRPVVAFAPEEEGADLLKGSARSIRGLHIRDVLAYVDARNPGLMNAFGGHAMAAGLTLRKPNLSKFGEQLVAAVTDILDGDELAAEILTDGTLSPDELNLRTAFALENAGPWGQHFPEPLFDGVFRVVDARVVGTSHLKMCVQSVDGGDVLDAIAFNHLPDDLPESGSARMLYRLGINRWRGRESCQLMVQEIRD